MPSCKNCGLDISDYESDTHRGYCEKCYSEWLERAYPIYWAGSRGGPGPFAIPSPETLKKQKLELGKTVIAFGAITLVVTLVVWVCTRLSDFGDWVFQIPNAPLLLYEGSLLTLLVILLAWLGATLKEKKQK
jgi:hypothetical protein